MADVPHLYVPSLSAKKLYVPHINVPHISVPFKGRMPKEIEQRYATDLGDILLGNPITGTKQLQNTLKKHDLDELIEVPLLNRIVGAGLMIQDRAIDPLLKGDVGTLIVNSLETAGQSLDTLANPVKALLPWAGGGSYTDLLKSMGWTDDEYREQYQWNTDSFLVNLIGEVISDPINWFTFGGNAAAKRGIGVLDDLVRSVDNVFTKNLGDNVIKYMDEYSDIVAKTTLDLAESTSDDASKIVQQLIKDLDDSKQLLQKELLHHKNNAKLVQDITERINSYTLTSKQIDDLTSELTNLRISSKYKPYRTWRKVYDTAKSIDNGLMSVTSVLAPGYGAGRFVLTKLAMPFFESQWKHFLSKLKEVEYPDLTNSAYKQLNKEIINNNRALYKPVYDSFDTILAEYNLDYAKLVNRYVDMYYQMKPTELNLDNLNEQFTEELYRLMPKLKTHLLEIEADTNVNKLVAEISEVSLKSNRIMPEDKVKELVEAVSDAGVITLASDEIYKKKLISRTIQDVDLFWSKQNFDGKPTAITKLNYLDSVIKNMNPAFNLSTIPEFLEELRKINPDKQVQMLTIFGYMGITLDNMAEVKQLLDLVNANPDDTVLLNKLKGVLIRGKTGFLNEVKELDTDLKTIQKYGKRVLKNNRINIFGDIEKTNEYIHELNVKRGQRWTRNAAKELSIESSIHEFYDINNAINRIHRAGKIDIVTGREQEYIAKDLPNFFKNLENSIPDIDYSTPEYKAVKELFEQPIRLTLAEKSINSFTNSELQTFVDDYIKARNWFVANGGLIFNSNNIKNLEPRLLSKFKNFGLYLVTDDSVKIVADLKDLLNNAEDLFINKVADEGQFDIMNQVLSTSEIDKDFYTALSDTEGDLRKSLKSVIALLETDEQKQGYNKMLSRILSTLDNTNNINNLLNYMPVTRLIDEKDYTDYTRGLLFNIIHENRNKYAAYMATDQSIAELTERFMQQIKLDKTELFNIDGFEDTLRKHVSDAFKKYTDRLVYISSINQDYNLRFGQHWSNAYYDDIVGYKINSAKALQNLGLDYLPTVLTLLEQGATPKQIVDTTRTIRMLSNNALQSDYNAARRRILKYLTKSKQPKEVMDYVSKELNYLATESLSDAILKAHKAVAYNNKILAGTHGSKIGKYWSENGTDKVHNFISLVYANETDSFVRAIGKDMNRYNASTQNGVLSFKKIYNKKFMEEHKLNLSFFSPDITEAEYARLYQQYEHLYKLAENTPAYNSNSIKNIRNCLIDVYSNTDVSFKLQDPYMYFNSLTDFELITWDALTRSKSMSAKLGNNYIELKKKRVLRYKYSERADYRADPMSKYLELEDLIYKEGITDSLDIYNSFIKSLPINSNYNPADKIILDNLNTYVKDVDSLKEFKTDIDNYQRNNVEAYNNLKTLDDFLIDPDEYEVTEFEKKFTKKKGQSSFNNVGAALKGYYNNSEDYNNVLHYLSGYEIGPDMNINNEAVRVFHSFERNEALNKSFDTWSATDLRSFIDTNNKGLGILVYQVPKGLQKDAVHLGIKFSKKELTDAGLKVSSFTKPSGEYYVFRRTDNKLVPSTHRYLKPSYTFIGQQNAINEVLESDAMFSYKATGQDLPFELYTGSRITEDNLAVILQDPDIIKALDDGMGRNSYSIFDKNGINTFWENKLPKANTIFVGDLDCYNNLIYETSQIFKGSSIKPVYDTHIIDRDVWSSLIAGIELSSVEQRMLQTMFNEDFSFNGPVLRDLFEGKTDKEIQDVFKNQGYIAAILRQDRKGRPKIYKIAINSNKDLLYAKKAKAVMLTPEMYRTLVLGINQHKIDNAAYRIYAHTIAGTHKSVFIGTAGTLFRNGLDSAIYKNAASTRGMFAILDNLKYEYRAAKLIDWFDGIQRRIMDYSLDTVGVKTLNKKSTQAILKELSDEDKKLYILLDKFMNSGASAGLSKTMEEIIFENNILNKNIDQYALERYVNEAVFRHSYITLINNINDKIEQSSRLGLFLCAIDNGLKPDDAIRLVVKTHFDYEVSSVLYKPIEQLFWFATFPINNVLYYLNDGLTKNPDMLKLQLDALELSYNDDDYTWDDVRNSDYLTYNALVGNIRFEIAGKQIILKTGSSVMDFFNLLINPFGEAIDRINPYLSVLLGLEDSKQLFPHNSILNRTKQLIQGRSYIPSLYSELYPRYEYKERHYIEREPYKYSSWSKKPRIKKTHSNVYFNDYRFMTNKYYWGKTRMMHRWYKYDSHIEPYWYMNNYKLFRSNGRYGRQVAKLKLPKAYKTGYNR